MAHVFQKRIPHFFNDRNWNRKLRFDFLQRSSKSKSHLEFSNIKDTRNLWQVFWVGSNSDPPTVYCGGGALSFYDESLPHLVLVRCASISSGGSNLADLHSQYLIAHPGCLTHSSNGWTSWICLFSGWISALSALSVFLIDFASLIWGSG